jgi:hypothetical protein
MLYYNYVENVNRKFFKLTQAQTENMDNKQKTQTENKDVKPTTFRLKVTVACFCIFEKQGHPKKY